MSLHSVQMNARERRLRTERLAAGLCPRCGGEPEPPRTLCPACLAWHRQQYQRRFAPAGATPTPDDAKVLRAIQAAADALGYQPTLYEVADHLGLGVSATRQRAARLAALGWAEWAGRRQRTLHLTLLGWQVLQTQPAPG